MGRYERFTGSLLWVALVAMLLTAAGGGTVHAFDGVIEGVAPLSIDLSAASLTIGPLEEVRAHIPAEHPRLFVRPESLDEFRAKQSRSMMAGIVWRNIRTQAMISAVRELPPEPPDARPGGVFDVVAWRAGITIASQILNDLHSMAFAFLMTGDEQYGRPAKELLLHVASWDPYGTSGRAKNDEVSMRLLYGLSRAYDWLHPLLNEEERALVQGSMRERGNDVYLTMRRIGFEETLRNNHLVRSMGFLGEAALAFMGELPEAEVWFDYIVSLFVVKYPPWGGDEGGWSQGVSYWQSYVSWVLEFLDAFKIATGVDLYEKPFFRNTGYFKLYAHPPGSKIGAFGDHSDSPPNEASARVLSHFATVYSDPALQWYAAEISGLGRIPVLPLNNFIAYVRVPESAEDMVSPELPPTLPQSRLFSDVGWALMNVDMADWENNVHVKFKSSPYGSFNHSHAEQNSFIIEAYGSPLAISSGYYPWYGSPHHATWTWESRSKNTILVDGEGQGVQSFEAKGSIVEARFGHHFDYVLGDATPSYEGRLDRYWRHVWFVKPNLILVYDELEAEGAHSYDWLLHSEQAMELDEANRRLRVPAETAHMWVSFVTPAELTFSETDQFTVRPEDRDADKPNQWHFTASTATDDGRGRFLTVLAPRPGAEVSDPPQTRAVATVGGDGAEIVSEGRVYTVAFRNASAAAVQVEGWTSDATGLVVWHENGKNGLMIVRGTYVERDGAEHFRSLVGPVDASLEWNCGDEGALNLQLPSDAPAHVRVHAECAPSAVIVNEQDLPTTEWSYDGTGSVEIRHTP